MGQKAHKKAHNGTSTDRWLISYADFVTLLFAAFVVLFAASADKSSAESAAEAIQKAFGGVKMNAEARKLLAKGPSSPPVVELLPSMKYLTKELATEIRDGKIDIHLEARGLIVSLREAAFFAAGDDKVNPAGMPQIEKVANMMRNLPNSVRLEGHTDSVPIHTDRFRSNWELSAARSIAMMELLSGKFAIPQQRISIAGYADTVPVDSNGNPEGRAHNRRVDIAILNQGAALSEPGKSPRQSVPAQP